jgi:hypothetical protein
MRNLHGTTPVRRHSFVDPGVVQGLDRDSFVDGFETRAHPPVAAGRGGGSPWPRNSWLPASAGRPTCGIFPGRSKDYALIDEFLAEHGHTLPSVDKLPPAERRELLRRASSYATLRLAEIESRAHFVDDLER